ncbi:MAG: asparagine synthase (glutamine-hydrolyzing) [Caulobacteraceae bacterium]
MCGIAGLVTKDGSPARREVLARMIAQIRHRGPDASGVEVRGPAGLAHARLSIIDLAGGVQPMSSTDGRLTLSFNGEIFNYIELREALIRQGRVFATHSDTEVVLQAYDAWGADCVKRFNGQWAFAVWDARDNKLFASRDRIGVRPLHYAETRTGLVFASEAKAIFAEGSLSPEIDPIGLDQIFTTWAPLAPTTVFKGVKELPPGCNLTYARGVLTIAPYWSLDYAPAEEHGTAEAWAEQLLDLLLDATRIRLRADVPVGAYLSGGLDSTVIASLVRKLGHAPLETFSVAFEDADFDESGFQAQAAAALGTRHHSVICGGPDIAEAFPSVIAAAERPILRTAPAPLWMLARKVRAENYKVVLTGEGADEMLGGYDIFKEAKVRRWWAKDLPSRLRPALLQRLYPYMPNLTAQPPAYLQAFFAVRPEDLADPCFSHRPRWDMTAKTKLFFSEAMKAELSGRDAAAEMAAALPAGYAHWDHFSRAQYLEAAHLLPGYILSSQGDRMAMAHGVEGRFPFLDARVMEFAAKIPPRLKMRVLNEKYLLKLASADLIPEAIRRRPKQPYRAPDASAFFDPATGKARADWIEALTDPSRLAQGGVFNPRTVSRLIDKARAGQISSSRDGMALTGVLSTQLLIDQFIHRTNLEAPHDHAA